jgi:hypothetical protein
MNVMEEKSYEKISLSIDERRARKGRGRAAINLPHPELPSIGHASRVNEDLTPTEAFSIAKDIASTFKKIGLAGYIKDKIDKMGSGDHFLALTLINNPKSVIDRELSLARRVARERTTQEIFGSLKSYNLEAANNKLLTPYLVADAEECERRFAGNVEKK